MFVIVLIRVYSLILSTAPNVASLLLCKYHWSLECQAALIPPSCKTEGRKIAKKAHGRLNVDPRWLQDGPKIGQDGSKVNQESARWTQDGFKSPPKVVQEKHAKKTKLVLFSRPF